MKNNAVLNEIIQYLPARGIRIDLESGPDDTSLVKFKVPFGFSNEMIQFEVYQSRNGENICINQNAPFATSYSAKIHSLGDFVDLMARIMLWSHVELNRPSLEKWVELFKFYGYLQEETVIKYSFSKRKSQFDDPSDPS